MLRHALSALHALSVCNKSSPWDPCGYTRVVQVVQLHERDALRVHVDVHVLCRSFNYTDEMCWRSMWLYMCCVSCTCVVQVIQLHGRDVLGVHVAVQGDRGRQVSGGGQEVV